MAEADGKANEDPRVYFALERTFLAWIRTGLGLMGIGFAVARFGLFLRELHGGPGSMGRQGGLSVYSGVVLVLLGVLVNAGAMVHQVRTVHALRSGRWVPGIASQAMLLAGLLALLGLGMAVFLLVLR